MPENKNAGDQAREQAEAYKSTFAPTPLTLDDGTVIEVPPHPSFRMFDDDALAAKDQLDFELESYDRHPDTYIPEQIVKDKSGNEMKLPAETNPGPLKTPYRKTDPVTGEVELLNPAYEVRLAQIALGDDYEKLRNGTINGRRGCAADVQRIWSGQGVEIRERRAADSKSDGGAGVLEDVAETDSE